MRLPLLLSKAKRWSSFSTVSSKEALFESLVLPKLRFLKSYGFSASDFRNLIQNYKPLIQLPLQNRVQSVVDLLERGDPSKEEIGLNLSRQQVRDVVMKFPEILGLSVERRIHPILHFWIRDMGLSREQISRLAIFAPNVFGASLKRMKSQMFFFHNRLAEVSEIAEIFEKFPKVLDVPLRDLIRFHDYWKEQQLSDRDFNEMIVRHPSLLRLSFDQIIQPMIRYMIFICQHRRGARLFVDHPTFFEMPLDELSIKVEYLLSLGITSRSFAWMIRCHPKILRMDLERELKSRVNSLIHSRILSLQRLAEILPDHPEIITDIAFHSKKEQSFGNMSLHVTSCPIV